MLDKLKKIMLNHVDSVDGVTEASSFIGDVGMSSMSLLVFLGDVEEEFDIKISDKDYVKLQTLGDLIQLIKEQQK